MDKQKLRKQRVYYVYVPSEGVLCYEVKASSEDEAKELIAKGEGCLIDANNAFKEDINTDNWEVELSSYE